MRLGSMFEQWNGYKILIALIISFILSLVALYDIHIGLPHILPHLLLYVLTIALFAVWSKDIFSSFLTGFEFYMWLFLWHSTLEIYHADLSFLGFITLGCLFGVFGSVVGFISWALHKLRK